MNVLWLAPHPVPEHKNMHPAPWIATLATGLVQHGIKITVVTTSTSISEAVREYQLEHYKLYSVKVPGLQTDLFKFLKTRILTLTQYIEKILPEYDLVHVHGTEFQLASSLQNIKPLTKPVVISIQGLIYEYKKYFPEKLNLKYLLWCIYAYYEKKEIRHFDNFMCRTHWDEGAVKSLHGNARVFEIWEILRDSYQNTEPFVAGRNILFPGGANPLKGLSLGLEVFDELLKKEKDLQLNVIGNCDWSFVASVCKSKNLKQINQQNTKLWGLVSAEKMVDLYKDCYCLYHPSLIDNSPNSVCEAQLWGLPVLANNTGGLSSLITDMQTGILLTPGNKEEHVQKLNELRHNSGLQQLLSANARLLARKRHRPETIVEETIAVYKRLIAGE